MKNLVVLFVLIGTLFFGGCGSDYQFIVATGPNQTKVLSEPIPSRYREQTIVAMLNPGDTVKALDYRFLKSAKVYKVELKDGKTGWVTLGDNCDAINLKIAK